MGVIIRYWCDDISKFMHLLIFIIENGNTCKIHVNIYFSREINSKIVIFVCSMYIFFSNCNFFAIILTVLFSTARVGKINIFRWSLFLCRRYFLTTQKICIILVVLAITCMSDYSKHKSKLHFFILFLTIIMKLFDLYSMNILLSS